MSLYLPKHECAFMSRKLGSMNDYSGLLCVTQCKQTHVTVELLKCLTRHAPLTAFYSVAVKLYTPRGFFLKQPYYSPSFSLKNKDKER